MFHVYVLSTSTPIPTQSRSPPISLTAQKFSAILNRGINIFREQVTASQNRDHVLNVRTFAQKGSPIPYSALRDRGPIAKGIRKSVPDEGSGSIDRKFRRVGAVVKLVRSRANNKFPYCCGNQSAGKRPRRGSFFKRAAR